MAKGPEAKVKTDCRAHMREVGAYVFSPVQMGYGDTTLDDLVCFQGLFFAFEYKRPDTRPPATPRQKLTMHKVQAAGGIAKVIYDVSDLPF